MRVDEGSKALFPDLSGGLVQPFYFCESQYSKSQALPLRTMLQRFQRAATGVLRYQRRLVCPVCA